MEERALRSNEKVNRQMDYQTRKLISPQTDSNLKKENSNPIEQNYTYQLKGYERQPQERYQSNQEAQRLNEKFINNNNPYLKQSLYNEQGKPCIKQYQETDDRKPLDQMHLKTDQTSLLRSPYSNLANEKCEPQGARTPIDPRANIIAYTPQSRQESAMKREFQQSDFKRDFQLPEYKRMYPDQKQINPEYQKDQDRLRTQGQQEMRQDIPTRTSEYLKKTDNREYQEIDRRLMERREFLEKGDRNNQASKSQEYSQRLGDQIKPPIEGRMIERRDEDPRLRQGQAQKVLYESKDYGQRREQFGDRRNDIDQKSPYHPRFEENVKVIEGRPDVYQQRAGMEARQGIEGRPGYERRTEYESRPDGRLESRQGIDPRAGYDLRPGLEQRLGAKSDLDQRQPYDARQIEERAGYQGRTIFQGRPGVEGRPVFDRPEGRPGFQGGRPEFERRPEFEKFDGRPELEGRPGQGGRADLEMRPGFERRPVQEVRPGLDGRGFEGRPGFDARQAEQRLAFEGSLGIEGRNPYQKKFEGRPEFERRPGYEERGQGRPGFDKSGLDGRPGLEGRLGPDGKQRAGFEGRPWTDGRPVLEGRPDGRSAFEGRPIFEGRPVLEGRPDGRSAFEGRPGLDGRPGFEGRPGFDGRLEGRPELRPGFEGRPGPDGRPAFEGRPGPDGRPGFEGRPGLPGRPQYDGRPGFEGRSAFDGRPGLDAQQRFEGRVGLEGRPGQDQRPGFDGRSQFDARFEGRSTMGQERPLPSRQQFEGRPEQRTVFDGKQRFDPYSGYEGRTTHFKPENEDGQRQVDKSAFGNGDRQFDGRPDGYRPQARPEIGKYREERGNVYCRPEEKMQEMRRETETRMRPETGCQRNFEGTKYYNKEFRQGQRFSYHDESSVIDRLGLERGTNRNIIGNKAAEELLQGTALNRQMERDRSFNRGRMGERVASFTNSKMGYQRTAIQDKEEYNGYVRSKQNLKANERQNNEIPKKPSSEVSVQRLQSPKGQIENRIGVYDMQRRDGRF